MLILSKESYEKLVDLIKGRHQNYFRNRKLPIDYQTKKKENVVETYNFNFDPEQELAIYTPALRGSMNKIIEHVQHPEILKAKVHEERENRIKAKQDFKEDRKRRQQEALYDDESALIRKRMQLKKEKRLKLKKEENKERLAKRKQIAAMTAARNTQNQKGKKK